MTKHLAAFVWLALAGPVSAEPPGVPLKDSLPHMTTTGEASLEVVPDQAELHLGVRQERKTADEATDATAEAAKAVISAIKTRGVEAGDIHTTFTLTETFDAKKDDRGVVVNRVPRGYEANERISVRVHDTAKVGPLTRDLIAKGANSFEGIDFSFSKEKQRRRDLDTEAMRDAFQQARIYTEALGLKLGRVLQIGEDPSQGNGGAADMPSRRAPPAFGATGVVIPVEPGTQRLFASVTVIWEIEGAAK